MEGHGLPDWCQIEEAKEFAKAEARVDRDGVLHLTPSDTLWIPQPQVSCDLKGNAKMTTPHPTRRVCLCEVTPQALVILKRHLPKDVEITLERELPYKDAYEIRLEGDALPDWAIVAPGQYYMKAVVALDGNGFLMLTPGSGIPVEQVSSDLLAKEANLVTED